MSRLPRWVGGAGAGLTRLARRLEERSAEAEGTAASGAPGADAADPARTSPPNRSGWSGAASAPDPGAAGGLSSAAPAAGDPVSAGDAADSRAHSGPPAAGDHVPPPPGYAPAVPARPDPVAAVPWGVRVAAEVAWRLLILAGTLWVLMRVISAVRLVVLSFVVGLLITALLQPTVAWLKRRGVPRGLATVMTFISGFVVMGLVGWFVVWQVTDNLDDLSGQVQQGIKDLKHWLLTSPFHVTEKQINNIADNLSTAIGANTKDITSAGIEGVQVILEVLTGILLAMFSTLFLLYDGPRIWEWLLKLFPAAAREGVAGAGPRAWATLTAYVRGTVIVALIDAIFIGIGLFFLKVPLAVPLAVFIFLFAFVPLVGAVVSGALAVVVALVTKDVFTALMVLIVVLAVQQIEGHVLQPFILGRAVRVHPLAVVLSVVAGSLIAGIGGAVVAVPLVAVTNTVVGYLRAFTRDKALAAAPPDGPPPPGEPAG
ncbi:AI-2E family transporter [Streptosporangium nondiastaticum]|uniref:AI-2E family transporter n=1 Tax=Streptosporangium nondiastaticum TaxID=35764 RepID=A0A9X7PG36_9ACTN|nr:AI-2E family transporter [Streptosporangium nondiastaticum]PSJ26576.1 AI-2E family transporter [Streptosporangium nondiastaticum]